MLKRMSLPQHSSHAESVVILNITYFITFPFRCPYFTSNRTWSPNYSVLVYAVHTVKYAGKYAENIFCESPRKLYAANIQGLSGEFADWARMAPNDP